MRASLIYGSLMMAAFGAVSAGLAHAQILPGLVDPCNTCRMQTCSCTTVRPVVETRYRQEQVLTYRDVKQTAVRQEAVCETVPVTTYQNVTVDEGAYQMVWVPKPVTKQVAQTQYRQQVSYRNVPVEITQRVPQMTTRVVPEQTVRYVTEHTPVVAAVPVNPCPPTGIVALPGPPLTAVQPMAATLVGAVQPLAPVATPVSNPIGLVPPASYATVPAATENGTWTTISSRNTKPAASAAYDDDMVAPATRRTRPASAAPTAATVWQSQR